MEHRNGSRKPIGLNVRLHRAGEDVGWYLTKDIGPGGLSVKGKVKGLEKNSLVTVGIERVDKGETKYTTLKAFVIHQSDNSTGLMWAEYDVSLDQVFQDSVSLAA